VSASSPSARRVEKLSARHYHNFMTFRSCRLWPGFAGAVGSRKQRAQSLPATADGYWLRLRRTDGASD
jgi:hypothetical protein